MMRRSRARKSEREEAEPTSYDMLISSKRRRGRACGCECSIIRSLYRHEQVSLQVARQRHHEMSTRGSFKSADLDEALSTVERGQYKIINFSRKSVSQVRFLTNLLTRLSFSKFFKNLTSFLVNLLRILTFLAHPGSCTGSKSSKNTKKRRIILMRFVRQLKKTQLRIQRGLERDSCVENCR